MESEVHPQRPKTNTSTVITHLRKVLGQNYQNPSAAMTWASSVTEFFWLTWNSEGFHNCPNFTQYARTAIKRLVEINVTPWGQFIFTWQVQLNVISAVTQKRSNTLHKNLKHEQSNSPALFLPKFPFLHKQFVRIFTEGVGTAASRMH